MASEYTEGAFGNDSSVFVTTVSSLLLAWIDSERMYRDKMSRYERTGTKSRRQSTPLSSLYTPLIPLCTCCIDRYREIETWSWD